MLLVLQLGPDGHDDLTDVNSGHRALRLPEGPSHARLETIGSRTGQHLVDADDVEGMQPHSDVKTVFAAALHHVLVGADSGGLQSFGRELLVFIRHHVATQRELVHFGLLPTQVKDADLGIGNTPAEARFRIRFILAIAVTACRAATHSSNGQSRCSLVQEASKAFLRLRAGRCLI